MKFLALLVLSAALLTSACGNNAAPGGEKVFRYGTPAYGIANENAGMDPHEAYQGWSAIRYGVGETLFKFDDAMQPQPWLAEKYEFINENTVKITLKDNIYFTSGNKMTGAAVKACLEDLISRHNRARVDLKITGITAEGQTVTITSAAKVPVLINYLCDPYGCIIDMSRDTGDDTKISGTGPFMVESLTPKEVVLVKNPAYYGGVPKTDLATPDVEAVKRGIVNLEKHIENIKQYGLPLVVAINAFAQDTPEELEAIRSHCAAHGVNVALSEVFAKGGEGGIELAKEVVALATSGKADFKLLYGEELSLKEKIETIAKNIYGAVGVNYTKEANNALKDFEKMGYGHLPVCMAKTQYSFSDDPALLGRPEGFEITIKNCRIAAGAGFVVVLTGDIMTMPGLPKVPAAEKIDVSDDGVISGLF